MHAHPKWQADTPRLDKSIPMELGAPLIDPQLLCTIEHNGIREKPLLCRGTSLDAFHPSVGGDDHGCSIKKPTIDESTCWALPQQRDIRIGLEDLFVILDAWAGDLIKEDGFVLLPHIILQVRLRDILALANKGCITTEQGLGEYRLPHA